METLSGEVSSAALLDVKVGDADEAGGEISSSITAFGMMGRTGGGYRM